MKQIRIHIFIVMSLSWLSNSCTPSESAMQWARTVTAQSTAEDLQLIANLIYWSHYRSRTTLQAQKAFVSDHELCLQAGHSIAQTRLNPAAKNVQHVKKKDLKVSRDRFIQALTQHQRVGAIYTHSVDHIVNGSLIRSTMVHNAIDEMRNNARVVIAQSLLAALTELQKNLLSAQNLMTVANTLYQQQTLHSRSGKFLNYLWDYLPLFMIKSFVRFDAEYITLSEKCWQAVIKSEEFSNMLWEVIEEPRAAFYADYYEALYYAADIPAQFMITFNENGFIPPDARKDFLPLPCELKACCF